MAESKIKNLVPMPAFTDPNLPEAAGGSINFGVASDFPEFSEHPVAHSDDYGQGLTLPDPPDANARSSWKKDDWVSQAKTYSLDEGGTVAELKARVEKHEADNNLGGE